MPDYAALRRELNEGASSPASSAAWPRADARSGWKPPIILCWTEAGRPLKVVKLAVDITKAEQASRRRARITAAEAAQAKLVGALAERLSRLSDGDLRAPPLNGRWKAPADGEADFNGAVTSLRTVMEPGALAAVTTLRSGSDEISQAPTISRAHGTAGRSPGRTAAALDQITTTVSVAPGRRSGGGCRLTGSCRG